MACKGQGHHYNPFAAGLCLHGHSRGDGSDGSTARNAHRGSVVCLEGEVTLLSGAWGRGRAATTLTRQLLHPRVPGGTPTRASAPQSVATACWSLPPQATHTHPNCGRPANCSRCALPGLSKCDPISCGFCSLMPGQGRKVAHMQRRDQNRS